jgi:hypothetical protein
MLSSLVIAALMGVTGYTSPALSRSALVFRSSAVPPTIRASAAAARAADDESLFGRPADLFASGSADLAAAVTRSRSVAFVPTHGAGARALGGLHAFRRTARRLVSTLLASLLSTFFFSLPAFAATTAKSAGGKTAAKVVTAAAGPSAGALLAAGAAVGVAAFAANQVMQARRAAEGAAAVKAAAAVAEAEGPIKLNQDALMMASLRDRMLSLSAERAATDSDADAATAVADDELDATERAVRDARSAFPGKDAKSAAGSTAMLERPEDEDEVSSAGSEQPLEQQGPAMADAETIERLNRLFGMGGGAAPQ